ncbi:uncharacterized protein LOC120650977 isoform X3 [Panicum virgatum]|uniref:Uncharacterized protein n=1 Tax=Panicum virgatum TaxID=38727 RepID=A0A8T0NFX6_PANVG|nr:uncharacterized protein LOC120650977 isoform X3 [Panicum virgatum]KAG2548921.1 hypothetical protein PVAP13_9KG206500 [Panicum virgatum]
MAVAFLRELKYAVGSLLGKGEVMQDLEYSMRSKGKLTPLEEARLRTSSGIATRGFIAGTVLYSFVGWFVTGSGTFLAGKLMYYIALRLCAEVILENDDPDDRMKMELANIILTKHSNDKPLVEAVRKQFFAEHLFNDLHQDSPLFRWHPCGWYVDSAFMERLKETEAELNCSDNETGSYSRQTVVNIRFGDLMDDPLDCVLGSLVRDKESHNLSENKIAVLKRRGPRNRKRSHRHQLPTEC